MVMFYLEKAFLMCIVPIFLLYGMIVYLLRLARHFYCWVSGTRERTWKPRQMPPSFYDLNPPPNTHQYDPLRDSHIRILLLHGGAPSDEINCELLQFRLDESDLRNVEALSYTWGDDSDRRAIICSGQRTNITVNLYKALHHLRRRYGGRLLWADAICINQNSLEERSQQVSIMSEIYSKVWYVVIWLGEDNRISIDSVSRVDELLTILPSWSAIAKCEGNHANLSRLIRDSFMKTSIFDPLRQPVLRTFDWQPLIELFSRPWFQRKWIIQECVMAKRVKVVSGAYTTNWSKIAELSMKLALGNAMAYSPFFYDDRGRLAGDSMETVRKMLGMRERLGTMERRTLLGLILSTKKSLAKDPRDHIFAIINLADDVGPEDPEIQPNYRLSQEELFLRVATWGLIKQKNMAWLSCATDRSELGLERSLPSWVPNFAGLHTTWPINPSNSLFKASGMSEVDAWLSEDPISGLSALHLTGRQIDKVVHLGNTGWSGGLPAETMAQRNQIEFLRHNNRVWFEECREISRMAEPAATDDDFWRTMICDMDARDHGRATPNYGDAFAKFVELHSEDFDQDDLEANPASYSELLAANQLIQPCLINNSMSRRFCSTSNQRLGQMPTNARQGDWICVFNGATVPYVLRPLGDDRFALVGDCYLSGVMDGEAMEMQQLKTREFIVV